MGQLAYLLNHPKGYIHAIFSTNEALLWPVEKVITRIDYPTSFTFIDKTSLLQDSQISPDQFLDSGIIAGSSLSRPIPNLLAGNPFTTAVEMVRVHQSGLRAIDLFHSRDPRMGLYRDEFIRTRTAIRHGFVMTTEGTCTPLSIASSQAQPADVPSDIEKIFSSRLPDELYYYMCKGLISPTVIGWLTTGHMVENIPLADSDDYQKYVRTSLTEHATSPRVLSLAILLDALHPQWKEHRVVRRLASLIAI